MKKFLFRFEDSATWRRISLLAVFTFMFMGLGFSQSSVVGTSPSSVESILRNYDLKSEKSLILPILKAEYANLEQQSQVADTPEVSLKMFLTSTTAEMVVNNVEIYSALSKSYVKLIDRSKDFKGVFDLEGMLTDLVEILD